MSGATSYHAGKAAEDTVAADYQRRGYALAASRWRSKAGEIDIVMHGPGETIFVEVKRARDFDTAAWRLSERQLGRILQAAEIWLGTEEHGTDSAARVDVALVNGLGAVSIVENVMAA
ncbi:MAG: YraN family protein [Pseudomonadota bacterium]